MNDTGPRFPERRSQPEGDVREEAEPPEEEVPLPISPQDAATYLAVGFGVMVAFSLLGLMILVLPQARWILAVIGGGAAFILLHYFTWGRALAQWAREYGETEE